MTPTATRPGWPSRWAERENDRRRHEYAIRARAWHRRHDELIRLRIEAAGFLGCMQPRTGLPVDLDDDEVVYRVLPAVELVEAQARHVPGLPTPGLAGAAASVGAPGRPLPGALRIVDAGMAVVTNHRVAFSGHRRRREWRYLAMVGPAHHPDIPLTLLHTTDGGRLAGLLVPGTATVNFRFYLTLAFAAATGKRAAVAAQIDNLLAAHQGTRPLPPPPVEPDQATPTPLRPGRLTAAAAALLALAFAALSAGTLKPEQPDSPHRAGAPHNATVDPPRAIGTTVPSTPATPATPTSGTRPSPTEAAPPPTGGAPRQDRSVPRQAEASRGTAAKSAATDSAGNSKTTTRRVRTADSTASTTPRPTTGPASTGSPSPEPSMVSRCPGLLQLPIVEPLLCPPANH
ncbi:hypothetical protein FXF50_00495 [Micromonospora sp. AP08]|uniref:hypothetical protein n=1 Tax=Micromonospora sp. AP08 TaxID=2604467 RepID=UPI0011DBBE62|nr:hypothetical protein [Micromonospora sp. AP08]TYB40257.1 hypothetical protein FXF50_00495 [Micromonospora sp. AP08]